ncbi:hypothetical protein HNR46_001682 [Haloferula luteola]|uniref:DUF2961 domain-containing protein n=1 Tax=Haloferula luteola TaxID=595692 RepID=A0A840V320_9BACT|nr:glycoside hydrolase family 172 protein [Haloferula luteola]MBB5351446.1 hypothetical protein [Haloferula luteola]
MFPKLPFQKSLTALLLLAGTTCLLQASPVTTESLLEEMGDFDAIARWPDPSYVQMQASSHDRRTISPDQDGWFANDDHTQFLREEEIDGRREKVMLDAEGPGALVRFWLTTVEHKAGTLRIYLDHTTKPTLEFPAFDLMSGDLPIKEPFLLPHPGYTRDGNGGNTLMLPIPFARHCKVTWEEQSSGPRYYILNYRRYAPGTAVTTFRPSDLVNSQAHLENVGRALQDPPSRDAEDQVRINGPIPPGSSHERSLPSGPAAVTQLELHLEPQDPLLLARKLRRTILTLTFDGEPTVWCPIGDFFGSGTGLNALQSHYRTVTQDGRLTCRWTMPYRLSAKLGIINLDDTATSLQITASTKIWSWDSRSMHFHTAWHSERDLSTRPPRDWRALEVRGRGVYVGDTLSLFNPIATWYGEGDEKIAVDGDPKLRHLGTGTEDYYGYSFAPRGIMQTPFANQIRVDHRETQGHNVLTRTRNLDGIPFETSLDFDLELISWQPTHLDEAMATSWYAVPGSHCSIAPEPAQATLPIPTLEQAINPPTFPDTTEAEFLPILESSPGLKTEIQDMRAFGFRAWSMGAQLLGRSQNPGDFIVLDLPAGGLTTARIELLATQAPDYGNLRLTVNNQPSSQRFSGYANRVQPGPPLSLGTFTAVDGHFKIRIEVTDAEPATTGERYFFGIDGFRLLPPR